MKKIIKKLIVLSFALGLMIIFTGCGKKEFEVKFETYGGNEIESTIVKKGGYAEQPSDPIKKGFKFNGWFYEGEKWNFKENKVKKDMVIYANWSPENYLITYNGVNGLKNDNPTNYMAGSSKIPLKKVLKEGYTFMGWYDDNGTKVDFIPENSTGNIVLTAKFEKFTLTTESAGENGGDYTKYFEESVTAGTFITLKAMTMKGYTFEGWYDGDKLLTLNSSYTFIMPEKSVKYTAKWTSYTLTAINENEGYGDITKVDNKKISAGSTILLEAYAKEGYVFVGWFSNGELVCKDNKFSFVMQEKSVVYTARFEKIK